ncbi:MAG: amidohydrolase family protein [Acidobacteria bacterium]|nr:amidohydrolase family protein [Acidobacteriota bacterium]
MKKVYALWFLLVLPGSLLGQAALSSAGKPLVFTHVTVIDATGSPAKPGMTVLITKDRITALDVDGKVPIPKDAQVVDATGKFLIPGLWDMHVHTRYAGISFLPLFIANGVTGVRDTGSPWQQFEQIKRWRSDIAAGKLIGPRLVSAGPLVDGPNSRWTYSTVVNTPVEARKATDALKEKGADFVKVYDLLSRDEYAAIVDEAKKLRLPFVGHVPFAVSAAEASLDGQKSIEHLSGVLLACSADEAKLRKALVEEKEQPDGKAVLDSYSEEKASALFASFAKNGTWQVPTLVNTWIRIGAYTDDRSIMDALKYIPGGYKSQWNPRNFRSAEELAEYQRRLDKYLEIVGKMRRAGVQFMTGTDTLKAYNIPGFSLQQELVLLAKAGLTPMEVLQAATSNPARFLGLASLGTVERGKIADLVLLDANPLQDIGNTAKIAAVVVGGRFVSRGSLDQMLADVETAAKNWTGTPSGR